MIKARTKTVRLEFLRTQLLYDIKNIAYVEGDVMGKDTQHIRHMVQDIGEEGNVDRVTRIMDVAVAECAELLYPYSKKEVGSSTRMDDILYEADKYVIDLLVPDDFSRTTVTLLERYIHEFICYRVLADWFLITAPDLAQKWLGKQEAAEVSIKDALNARVGRVRKTQTPF
jgi:hypothetical protein